jgi:hypothetical protein
MLPEERRGIKKMRQGVTGGCRKLVTSVTKHYDDQRKADEMDCACSMSEMNA